MDKQLQELDDEEKMEITKVIRKYTKKKNDLRNGLPVKTITRRKNIPKSVKNGVWNEYIGKKFGIGKCQVCETEIDSKNFECGHIVSVKNNGLTIIENMLPICAPCNRSMGTKDLHHFKNCHFSDKRNIMDLC